MTTIAVSKNSMVMASDGRGCGFNMIVTDNQKKIKHFQDCIIGFSGDSGMLDLFCKEYQGEDIQEALDRVIKKQGEDEMWGMIVLNKEGLIFSCHHKAQILTEIKSNHWAIGSGSYWAIAAMDFRQSPKQAIDYAMTRDECTGGKIFEEKIK